MNRFFHYTDIFPRTPLLYKRLFLLQCKQLRVKLPGIELSRNNSKQYNALTVTLLLTGIMIFISSCSSIPTHKPITPEVSIANVEPLNLSLSGQKLLFTLKVKNPNAYDLPMQSLSFIASLAGEEVATGSSTGRVTIPAKGEALVDISVVAGLKNIMKQLKSITNSTNGNDFNLNYGVQGVLKLANWPAAIPFRHSGDAAPKIREQLDLDET